MCRLVFTKMEAGGNDFVILGGEEVFPLKGSPNQSVVSAICDRHYGVGADGVLWLYRTQNNVEGSFRIYCFNSDGSKASVCINGFRCAVLLAYTLAWTSGEVIFQSDIGAVRGSVKEHGVEICMPTPQGRTINLPDWAPSRRAYYVWTGDPHLVLPPLGGPMISSAEFQILARPLRDWTGIHSGGVNVHCVSRHPEGWTIRSFERGVEDETLACGSGTLAASLMLHETGIGAELLKFHTYGGAKISVEKSEHHWRMTGPARIVYSGVIDL